MLGLEVGGNPKGNSLIGRGTADAAISARLPTHTIEQDPFAIELLKGAKAEVAMVMEIFDLKAAAEAQNIKIFNSVDSNDATESKSEAPNASKEGAAQASEIDQIPQLKAASLVIGSNYGDGSRGDNGEEETAREIALREERKIVLLHERKVLLQKTEQTVAAFDEAMYDLCREKLKLDADLKTAEMRMLTFLGELGMLSEFEKKDSMLSQKMSKAKAEKASVATEISECRIKLEAKRKELSLIHI